MTAAKYYEFGPFRVDVGRRMLTRNGEPVPLAPKPFSLLVYLIRHPGQELSKDRLIKALWGGAVGSEANLNVNIAAIRKALGEKPRDHRYVVTIPLRGYSFVADVHGIMSGPDTPDAASPGYEAGRDAEKAPLRRLAVLPFPVSDPGPETESLGTGIADAITARAARFRDWAVQSSATVRRLAAADSETLTVARELEADAVVTGRIDRNSDRVAVSVCLIRTEDGAVLWGDSYLENVETLPRLPRRIADDLARAVDGHHPPAKEAGPASYTTNLDAFQVYLKGRALLNLADPRSVSDSLEHFREAARLDPEFALTYAGTAEAQYDLWRLGLLPAGVAAPAIETAARKAMALDRSLGDPCFWVAYLNMAYHWNWPVARSLFEQGLRTTPNSCLGHSLFAIYLLLARRHQDALAEVQTALGLEPMNLFANVTLANTLRTMGRLDAAYSQFRTLLDLAPDYIWGRFLYGWMLLQAERYEEALEEYEASRRRFGEIPYTHACMGYAQARRGNLEAARRHHRRLLEVVSDRPFEPYIIAFSHFGQNDHDRALEWLERAYRERSLVLTYLSMEPLWDPLRGHPGFDDLLNRIGRPES